MEFPQTESDGVSGYYRAETTVVESYAIVQDAQGADVERAQTLTPDLVPASFRSVMSNPVALVLDRDDATTGFLLANTSVGSSSPIDAFEVSVDSATRRLEFSGATSAVPFLDEPQCSWQFGRAILAQASQDEADTQLGGFRLSGRFYGQILQSDFLTPTVPGGCNAVLTKARDCYQNLAACGGNDAERSAFQSRVRQFFQGAIENGTLPVADIATVQEWGFIVTYN